MDMDYSSHPEKLVSAGNITPDFGIEELRKAIPNHCFKTSYRTGLGYLVRDLTFAALLMASALVYIPQISNHVLRSISWALYGYLEGLILTGLWVIAHECGHMSFSPSSRLNDTVGFLIHSALLTPYFSWKSTHRRHHIYANNLTMDHNYVPPQWKEYKSRLPFSVDRVEELTEDSPIVVLLRLVLQQSLGFPWYLLTNATAGPGSLMKAPSAKPFGNSHFSPTGSLFRETEARLVILSDLGLVAVGFLLWYAGSIIGHRTLFLIYIHPYVWVNHWIVAITYLHHTHPAVPKYEAEAWTFLKGATATVDRDFGWIGKHLLHGIIEHHVIHHLFSRIPFYHAEEATNAIIPILGASYHAEKEHGFFRSLWETSRSCQWVEPDNLNAESKDRAMWYQKGPSPYPAIGMAEGRPKGKSTEEESKDVSKGLPARTE